MDLKSKYLTVQSIDNQTLTCATNKGSLSAVVADALMPISYQWQHGATSATLSNLSVGTYTVSILDGSACQVIKSASILAPEKLIGISTIVANANTKESKDGQVQLNINGGKKPYRLSIYYSNGNLFSQLSNLGIMTVIDKLPAGQFTYEITDQANCKTNGDFQVNVQNCTFKVSLTEGSIDCSTATSSLTAFAEDGIMPYRFLWSNNQRTATITNLGTGTYQVTATDAGGCESIASVTIQNEELLSLSCQVIAQPPSIGTQGKVSIVLKGGLPNYSLIFKNQQTGSVVNLDFLKAQEVTLDLFAGSYTVVLKDNNNCEQTCSFQLTNPTCGLVGSLPNYIIPCGATTGTLQASATGNSGQLTYKWSNNVFQATNANLAPGTYRVSINDALNCVVVKEATVSHAKIDEDGDGYYIGCTDYSQVLGPDCNDKDKNINPGVLEICDGIDNNCDGNIDEGFIDTDGNGIPDCAITEICDGIDNNGDGNIDEGFADTDGDGLADCQDMEVCDGKDNDGDGNIDEGFADTDGDGIADCQDTETCDGKDNDGDGQIDEGFPDTDGDGTADCQDMEICDGKDNDGDGQIDEGFPDTDGDGTADCQDTEICDGKDNDGDGRIDEGFPDTDGDGTADCQDTEICDGLDNDGDGLVDEGFPDTDGDGTADCQDTEVCDGKDNDGDGRIDEGFPDTDGDGTADCQDMEVCDGKDNNGDGRIDEGFRDTDRDGIADCQDVEVCDGKDNDGDGRIDEGFRDTDGDGTADCQDTETCDGLDNDGDGLVDEGFVDTDKDGTLDCFDKCPNDPTKIEPDECGCGTPPQIDSDGDGIINCLDPCPYDLNQFVDGLIQCGQTITNHTFGGTSAYHSYGDCTTETYNGREFFYKFELNQPGDLIIRFKELSQSNYRRLGLFVLNDLCNINSCIGLLKSTDSEEAMLVIPNAPKGDYFFVVDARNRYDAAKFELTIACNTGSGQVACGADGLLYEDFEAYPDGADIAAQSQNWALFGNSSRSAFVETIKEGEKENKVLAFRRPYLSDVNFLLKGDFSGMFRLSWTMFIQKGQSAYFNIFGHPSTDDYGLKYIFDQNNSAFQDKWVDIEFFVDLTANKYTLFINNRQYSQSGDYILSLGRINFYAAPYSNFFIDNICYQQVESMPSVARDSRENNKEIVGKTASKQLKIGPNPVLNQLSVDFKFQFPKQQTQLEVYDCLGHRVIHQQLGQNIHHTQLDVSGLKNGIYYLSMANGKVQMMRKFVKID